MKVILNQLIKILGLLPCLLWGVGPYCLFTPPTEFAFANPKNYSSGVKIAFIGKSNASFTPSLNLTIEENNVSLSEYLKIAEKTYKSEGARWVDLGDIEVKGGTVRLTRVDTKCSWADISFFQAIYPWEGKFFILTTAAHKKEFMRLQKTFLNAIYSLQIVDNLTLAVEDPARREELQEILKEENMSTLEKNLKEKYSDLGLYWQTLVFKECLKNE